MELTEMTNVQMLSIASSLVATLFALLILLIGWLGNKLYDKLVSLGKAIEHIHARIDWLDKRLVVVETRCNIEHERRYPQ